MSTDVTSPARKSQAASGLTPDLKRKLLLTILESRRGDLREENLNRQGKGHFHVSGQGHEALAAFGMLMQPGDYVCPYYRDRALAMGRGVTTRQLALDYMAKKESSSRGRQMPAHFSYRELNIFSVATPTASQLLPACGMAWGMKLAGEKNVAIGTVGDAATRQGDFYEAIAFAKERQLPLLLIVEDNGYGISSPTRQTNPLALKVLAAEDWRHVDGWEVEQVYQVAQEEMARIREGGGPSFVWVTMERLSNHTSSDDQKVYRPKEELATIHERDPLKIFAAQLAAEGIFSEEEFAAADEAVRERVRADYAAAEQAPNPKVSELEAMVVGPAPLLDESIFRPGTYRMGDLINLTLREGLKADHRRVIFGEDVEDPKGGVFTLTKGLSTAFSNQVFNSPLAESTILGVACGLASYGWRPVFELQFIDFIFPGWNQLVSNLATLRWRSYGRWTCPAVIYAPYGAYLPGGSLWHSQANESAIAHFPGLNIVVPSTPEDAAGLLWTAMHADDPTIFLIPKHMLWAEREVKQPISAVPLGQARRFTTGRDVTIVAWGNTVEKSLEAIAELGSEASIELIDLRSIVPWDQKMVEESVLKTGRLVVVQEDTENCSVGQMIVSHLAGRPEIWARLAAPPVLVSKGNVMIGYNPIYELAALPDVGRIVEAVRGTLQGAARRRLPDTGHLSEAEGGSDGAGGSAEIPIKVPVMGEGIRAARMVSFLKQPGDAVAPDDPLCEVETDKAVYPIESAHAGVMGRWLVELDDTVEIGREIGLLSVDRGESPEPQTAGPAAAPSRSAAPPAPATATAEGSMVEPALPQAIVRRLDSVVPTNVQLDVRWDRVRSAREAAKAQGLDYSPSLMLAWCVTRAMTSHGAFRRLVQRDGSIVEREDFELGIAVALPGDRLATAAIPNANRLEWKEFADTYHQAITRIREGAIDEVQAPLNITSLGAFGIECATPIVVPPAMSTLFIGTAHERLVNDGGTIYPVEVATLSLTFDHKIVNGAGAAAFLHEVRRNIEAFTLPG